MSRRDICQPLLVFTCALAWFSLFQPWGGFTDPDGFYHAKAAALIARHGPIMTFPWLDLTTLGTHFADQHFLYHVALIPFEKLFGMLPGTQAAAVFFAASFILGFFFVLRGLKVPVPWLWCAFLAVSPHMVLRLTWAKASPFALLLFTLGLFAFATRRRGFAFLIGVVYALTHGGWIILLACQFLFAAGEWMAHRLAFGEKGFVMFTKRVQVLFATIFGIALGLLLHPNRREMLSFLWTQVFQVGVATPVGRVFMGAEWYPATVDDIYALLLIPFLVFGAVLFALVVSRGKELDRARASQVVGFLLASAVPITLMLKSMRFAEYAAPSIFLMLASLAVLVDWKGLPRVLDELLPRWALPVLTACIVFIVARQETQIFLLIRDNAHPFSRYDKPVAALRLEAKPGDRIYNSDWDIFPDLFAEADEFRYVSGMDPTFLLAARPDLSDAFTRLYQGRATSTAYDVVRNKFDASFIVVDRKNDWRFERIVRTDPRFLEFYQDDQTAVFRVLR